MLLYIYITIIWYCNVRVINHFFTGMHVLRPHNSGPSAVADKCARTSSGLGAGYSFTVGVAATSCDSSDSLMACNLVILCHSNIYIK